MNLDEMARTLLAEEERANVAETTIRELTGLLFTGLPTEEVDVAADPFDVANRVIARAEHIHRQIDALATVLMEEFGGPTQNESACEMAVRLLREAWTPALTPQNSAALDAEAQK
jgi:hypothetical protein